MPLFSDLQPDLEMHKILENQALMGLQVAKFQLAIVNAWGAIAEKKTSGDNTNPPRPAPVKMSTPRTDG